MLTDLKDDDEGQSGSQDVPELQGEFIRHWAPGRCSVVSVPAVSVQAVVRLEHRQAAVHVASQTPEGERRSYQTTTRATPPNIFKAQALYSTLTHPRGGVPCPHTGHIWRRKQSGGCSLRWWQWRRRWWWLPARRFLRESHARSLRAKPEENKHFSHSVWLFVNLHAFIYIRQADPFKSLLISFDRHRALWMDVFSLNWCL